MSNLRRSLAAHVTQSQTTTSKPSTTTRNRKSISSRTIIIQSAPDIKQHEAPILALSSHVIPQFLIATRYQGVSPQPFSHKTIRLDEFLAIYSHIMRQIDPLFKIQLPWNEQLDTFAKQHGYPFTIPTKSGIASFEVSESTRKALVVCLTWFVQFIQYFNAVWSANGIYAYHNVIKASSESGENGSPASLGEDGDLDPVTIFHLVRKNYHLWIKTGQDDSIAQELVSTVLLRQAILEEELKIDEKREKELATQVAQFNNIEAEIALRQANIAALQQQIQKEEDVMNHNNGSLAKIQAKIAEKKLIKEARENEAGKAQSLINNITALLSQQTQTDDDLKNIRKTQHVLTQQSSELDKGINGTETELTNTQQNLATQLMATQASVNRFNQLQQEYLRSNSFFNQTDTNTTTTTSLQLPKPQSFGINLPTLPALTNGDIQEYTMLYSQNPHPDTMDLNPTGNNASSLGLNPDSNMSTPSSSTHPDLFLSTRPITMMFKTTQQFTLHHDHSLPQTFKSYPVDALAALSQQVYQSKRLLSTSLVALTQEISNLDRDVAHEQTLLAQAMTQNEWLQGDITNTNAKIAEKQDQYQQYVSEYDSQHATLAAAIHKLHLREGELDAVEVRFNEMQNHMDQVEKDNFSEQAKWANVLLNLCHDVRLHFTETERTVTDLYSFSQMVRSNIQDAMRDVDHGIDHENLVRVVAMNENSNNMNTNDDGGDDVMMNGNPENNNNNNNNNNYDDDDEMQYNHNNGNTKSFPPIMQNETVQPFEGPNNAHPRRETMHANTQTTQSFSQHQQHQNQHFGSNRRETMFTGNTINVGSVRNQQQQQTKGLYLNAPSTTIDHNRRTTMYGQ